MPANHRFGNRAAFTLVEVLVASVVAGLVALSARGLYDVLTTHLRQVRRAATIADARANGDRLLRQVVRNAEAHIDADSAFAGDAARATFVSSCQTEWGWLERQTIALSVTDSALWSLVIVRGTGEDSTIVMRVPRPTTLQYLTSEAEGSTWVGSWSTRQMPPRAIGIVTVGDTTILPIGVRW